ncbi:hypothetical protein A4A49_07674 [Nicotiana attenuata]|uniref:RNase H type-1 domain-containing protein n=1 Tax=Nicotiana attenuata TaxID=49451 RepID=A0A1J6IBV8_NICAT|nr:hypothetical protein A4A49_07674 [Nicotiana attenuata]
MQNNLDHKVADLIDEDTHTWKLHKISTTFEPEDVDVILSILISIIGLNDRLLWHHSKSGKYEVKSDSGLRCVDRHESIGVAALNSLGKLLHAHGSPIQYVGKTMTAEAITIRKALECAISLGWKSVNILSDAKNVVDMIQKQVATSWEIEALWEDIWKLSNMFDQVEFLYIPRKLNKVAHSLAKFSISLLKDISWEKFFPTCEKLDTLVAMVNNNDSNHIIHAPTAAETTTGGVFDVGFGEDTEDHKLAVARRFPMVEEDLSTIGTGAEEIDVRKHKEVEPVVTVVDSQNILMRKDELMVVEEETVKLETDMGTDLADVCEEPAETKNDVDGNTYFTGQEIEKYVEESSIHLIDERSGAINMVLSDNVSGHIIHIPAAVFITLGAEKNHHAMRDPITTLKKYTFENNLTSEV